MDGMDDLDAQPPGMTPGEYIRIVLEDAQARGTLVGMKPSFTDLADSAGEAWTDLDVAPRSGTLLRLMDELDVHAEVSPDAAVLNVWVKDTHEVPMSTAPDLPPARRLLLEGVLAAWVGFMVTTFILSPRATLQGLMFGIPIACLTWYLWSFRDD